MLGTDGHQTLSSREIGSGAQLREERWMRLLLSQYTQGTDQSYMSTYIKNNVT